MPAHLLIKTASDIKLQVLNVPWKCVTFVLRMVRCAHELRS